MSATSVLASVVMMTKVRIHSPVLGSFQFSQRPAIPNGEPSFIAIAKGCFAFCPLIAFHSKKPCTGTMQRRARYASRNVGKFRTVSHFVLIGLRPPLASAPMRDQASTERIKGDFAGAMIAPDDQQ